MKSLLAICLSFCLTACCRFPGGDIPTMPNDVQASLTPVYWEHDGLAATFYAYSSNSGRSLDDAILIDTFNSPQGRGAERHWIEHHIEDLKSSTSVGSYRNDGRCIHEWKVVSADGEYPIYFDASYYHGVF